MPEEDDIELETGPTDDDLAELETEDDEDMDDSDVDDWDDEDE